jgi:hypothetical protein
LLTGLVPLRAVADSDADGGSCVGCHAEEDDPDLSDPVAEWRRSVHAEADVSCDGCHGGNPFEEDEDLAMDDEVAGFLGAPDWDEVPEFCGACHEDVLDGYGQSVMAARLHEGQEVAVCTTCHMPNGHDVAHSSAREILTEERCGRCHDGARAIVLRDLLEEIGGNLARARHDIDSIRHWIDVSVQDREVEELRARAVVIAHSYDAERIAEVASIARERLDGVAAVTSTLAAEAVSRRRLGTGVVGFWVAMGLGVVGLGAARQRSDSD